MCFTHWKVKFLYLDIIDSSSCAKYPIPDPVLMLKPNFQVPDLKDEHGWKIMFTTRSKSRRKHRVVSAAIYGVEETTKQDIH